LAVTTVFNYKWNKNNKGFFIKPHLSIELVINTRKLTSGIDSSTINIIDLKSKILNDGWGSAEKVHLHLKIDDITNDFEHHPWIEHGTDRNYTRPKRIQETTILRNEDAQAHIVSLTIEHNEAVVQTLNNQEGYALELDKKYHIQVKVTGHFNMVKWSFNVKPKSNGKFECSTPAEIY
jgi:hypothetical protein